MQDIINYPFELDDWQKNAVEKIINHESVLITAHTGCGKTIIAECAIKFAIQQNKKVVYTSPIKALSNQKFSEFTKKFNFPVGIITGDIKLNPDADCLIMTTEILRNLIYHKYKQQDLELDLDQVSTVIFDEIHYINDKQRGYVWEECLIMLPKHINLVMLSATIDKPEEFKFWIEKVRNTHVHLIGTKKRIIPLEHYYYLSLKAKKKLNKKDQLNIHKYCEQLIKIQDSQNNFYANEYQMMKSIKDNYHKYSKKQFISHKGIINEIIYYLKTCQLLPALFFTMSRNKCDIYVNEVDHILNTPYEAAQVEKIITNQLKKLDNEKDYITLDSFQYMKKHLVKGIGVHHSGILNIFKEITEILFTKGLIKVLFVTETFAVGVNMPTKTVLFTGLTKFDSDLNTMRLFHTHEYLQMSGRAGRRGLDNIGHVIHLPNLYDPPSIKEIESMMLGKTLSIKSQFNLKYQLILKIISIESLNLEDILNSSLLKLELDKYISCIKNKIQPITKPSLKYWDIFIDPIFKKKKPKNLPGYSQEYKLYKKYLEQIEEQQNNIQEYEYYNNKIKIDIKSMTCLLNDLEYLKNNKLTLKGIIASQITDCHEILLTEIIHKSILNNLTCAEIACILSIFTDSRESEINNYPTKNIQIAIENIQEIIDNCQNLEYNYNIESSNWNINLELLETTFYWAQGENIINQLNIFEGTFVKNMNKISCIATKLIDIYHIIKNEEMSKKCSQINDLIVRGIVTMDSLYIRN